jgi:hypothetical protein
MASRKEEKERLRQAREQAEAADRKAERKRLILGYAVAGVISVAVLVGIVFAIAGGNGDGDGGGDGGERVEEMFGVIPAGISVDDRDGVDPPTDGGVNDLETAAEAAGCELLTDQEDEGNAHIDPEDDAPDYKANPPTSGDHEPNPLADGAFAETPHPFNFIHALEHGRIQIQYASSLDEQAQLELLGLYDEDPAGMIIFPNDEMPYEVAATAWRQTLGCDSYEGAATADAIRAFKAEYRARGPEPVAIQ